MTSLMFLLSYLLTRWHGVNYIQGMTSTPNQRHEVPARVAANVARRASNAAGIHEPSKRQRRRNERRHERMTLAEYRR